MNNFDVAVAKQLETMDKLLGIQVEIERCQQLQTQLKEEMEQIQTLKEQIEKMKKELKEVQDIFEAQTEDAIRSYQKMESR
ncbi:YgaB family protein [Sutcliffiella rhizosphaerae]|uniref:YgaB family protein n=1 Tax=Sutcliffiella rhizosphaerae TaxID=2880967 RepID=UPI001E2E1FBF|nr:YgaB family protein [Sutcliffiella rhizosphaerae]